MTTKNEKSIEINFSKYKFEIREIGEKYLSIFQKLIVINTSVLFSLLMCNQAGAVNFSFTKIVDSNTPIPNGSGNFSFPPGGNRSFNPFSASVNGDNVFFQGFGSNSQSGIYANIGGVLSVVADTNTSIPNGTGNFAFGSFGPSFGGTFDLDGNNIAFVGIDSNSQSGVYTNNIGGVLSKIADTNTPIPDGTGNFGSLFGAEIDGNTVAFSGSDLNFEQEGIYTSVEGVLNVVVDRNTPIPGGTGNFGSFFGYSLDSNNIAFWGLDSNFEQSGIYTSIDGAINVVADTNTLIPGSSSNFGAFSFSTPSIDGDTVAFRGGGYDPDTFETLANGIYISQGGMLDIVADLNTFLPNSNAKFCQFDPFISLDNNNLVFGGSGCDPVTGSYLVGGIYAKFNDNLVKVIDFDDSLDGKEVSEALYTGSNALSGDSIAFWVRFTDGSDAIYLAQAVPESSSVLGLFALGIFGAGAMLKRIKRKQEV